jgi:hypothetical protein
MVAKKGSAIGTTRQWMAQTIDSAPPSASSLELRLQATFASMCLAYYINIIAFFQGAL